MHIEELLPKLKTSSSSLEKIDVLDCDITCGSFKEVLSKVAYYAEEKISSYVCFANVHMLYEAYDDDSFKTIVNSSDIVCPDGRPVSFLVESIKGFKQERICGMDFMPAILNKAEKKGLKVYFYGSTPDVLEAIEAKIYSFFPTLQVVGTYSPPFRKLTKEEDESVVKMINDSGAQLVLVSLGCPKQEQWMYDHKSKINACMLGVGQAFKTFCGLEKRLPTPLRNLGIEWLYRLSLEPKRLFKRYLYSNTWFLINSLKYMKR